MVDLASVGLEKSSKNAAEKAILRSRCLTRVSTDFETKHIPVHTCMPNGIVIVRKLPLQHVLGGGNIALIGRGVEFFCEVLGARDPRGMGLIIPLLAMRSERKLI